LRSSSGSAEHGPYITRAITVGRQTEMWCIIIVFLTTELDGRMPSAEVTWRDPGPTTMENRGGSRFEALVVDLKGAAIPSRRVTPPEVVRASETVAPRVFSGAYRRGARRTSL
jgi:hypothetical protein